MSFIVTFIGAGSLGFTRKLVSDLLTVPEFRNITIRLQDISSERLHGVEQLIRHDLAANNHPATIEATMDRRAALADAKYIINVCRIGGLEAFAHDIEVPLTYGVDQCVGDTLCAGGIMYGQRGIAAMLDFCTDIREVADPQAVLLNYANPMAMLTWAANTFGGVNCIGLCHGVQGGHHQITGVIQRLLNIDAGLDPDGDDRITVRKDEVDIICAGINHQTWYTTVRYQGEDWCPRLLEGFEADPWMAEHEKVRIDVLRRFGYYSTESNGHLSEYLPWYRKREHEVKDWISLDSWIQGETGGYLRNCSERTNWFEEDLPKMLEETRTFDPAERSEEHGSYIIEAFETGRIYRGHFNRINNGTISNLPADCVIEAPGYVDRSGLHMIQVGELPMGCAAICQQSINVQRLAVHAAVHADINALRQAFLLDPLVGAVCNPPEVWQLVDDMLIALADWLPQWREEAERAKARQDQARAAGTRLPTRDDYRGAARLSPRSAEELAAAGPQKSDAEMVGAK